ncbi:glutamine synthetase family protein [Blastococcus capsensis]|uniref:glutamine synthetase family protein n=1 Tax=Blastococcus capsensis TaxID=1564163 RepID=UPI002541BA53|nr:glutamine synthetase family protein [Blastococcus capsensis]MDK3256669.1 glutamine synthetase family protein [Blastococcus capsensis]
MTTFDQLRGQVDAGLVDEVVLALPDLAGRLLGTRLSARHFLDSTVADGFGACTYLLTTDVDMSVTAPSSELDPDGTGYGDMVLVPDLATLRPLPWDPGTVLVLADARHPGGAPVQVAPRQVLRRQVEALAGHGLVPLAGVELEFRVFLESYAAAEAAGWSRLTPASRTGVDYALVGLERMDALTRRLRRETVAAGLRLESARGECAPGQYEIVFRYGEALAAADAAAFYRTAAKQIAAQEGMALTFMPKYDAAEGNSCHLHVSLHDTDGAPVLAGDGPYGESPLLRRMLAGQLACLRELTLLFAPTVNAYKRLRPGAFAPTSVAWGPDNRLAALRLVGSGASLRLEHRVPGGDADPYLALAGVLLAARHGLENDLPLPDPVRGRPRPDAPALPASLAEAADLLHGSEVARKGLGDGLVDALVSAARAEWDAYGATVTEWERGRGFERR